jgi:hypothetical protein
VTFRSLCPQKHTTHFEQMKARDSDLTVFKRTTITDMATDVGREELRPKLPEGVTATYAADGLWPAAVSAERRPSRREAVVIRNGCPPGYALSELIGPRPIRQTLRSHFCRRDSSGRTCAPRNIVSLASAIRS